MNINYSPQVKTNKIELNNAAVHLERSYQNIVQLKKKLCSYSYEPRTYDLYEKLDDLKLRLELTAVSHENMMDSLKKPVHFIEVQEQQVQEKLAQVRKLEQGVLEYMSLAR